ncbi:thiamine pyrophosphate-binding protein [Halovulum sp. GXIMD14793]
MRTGGELVVDVLRAQGVERVFGVPGESYLAVLDALCDVDAPVFVGARHEGAAAFMADADGKMTGRPGVVMVTRGPGVTNAAAGVHVAAQDSTPMLVLVGLIGRGDTDREAFQEIDLGAVFGTMAKRVITITDAGRIPELLTQAYRTAMSGRPGPVVVGLPEDMLRDTADTKVPPRAEPVSGGMNSAQAVEVADLLRTAQAPFVIVGGEGWTEAARHDLARFAENWNLPVGASFRAQDRLPADHPNHAGHVGLSIDPSLAGRVRQADVLLVLGARLGDCTTTGYTLLNPGVPEQKIIHIHPSAEEPGRVFAPTLAYCAGMEAALAALCETTPPSQPVWSDHTQAARQAFLDWSTPQPQEHTLDLGLVMAHLNDVLPPEAILTNGAGNYAVWLHRYYRYRGWRSQLAPTSGSMGYGLPAAIAAKLRHPDRPVICMAGDGCFQMVSQELATARQYGAGIITIVVNNGTYGTIRMHQERDYPTRVSGTDMTNPDFTALAHAYGFAAQRVTQTKDFAQAFDQMLTNAEGGLIELVTQPEQILPTRKLSEL